MTAKEYLMQIYHIDRKVIRLQDQKDDLRSILYSIGLSPSANTADRVQSSYDPDKMAALVAKIDAKEREITDYVDHLINLKEKIARQVEMLGDTRYRDVLYYRYVRIKNGRLTPWAEIAMMLGYSEDHVKKSLHGNALKEFTKKYIPKSH